MFWIKLRKKWANHKNLFDQLSQWLHTRWFHSVAWFVSSLIALLSATVLFLLLQHRGPTPPVSLVVSVHRNPRDPLGKSTPLQLASAQYAVLEGIPFIHIHFPDGSQDVVLSDLWFYRADDENNLGGSEVYRGMNRFFGNTAIDVLLKNLYLLLNRWLVEQFSTPSSLPPPDNPLPSWFYAAQINSPRCLIRPATAYRFDFMPSNLAAIQDGNADEIRHLEIRNGSGSNLFTINLSKSWARDLWCQLRLLATNQSLTDRSIEILNGLEETADSALPLLVEPPLVEPQWGGLARDVSLAPEFADPSSLTSGAVLPAGATMLVSWTDVSEITFRDFLLLVVGATYGLGMAMALEALRPFLERRVEK